MKARSTKTRRPTSKTSARRNSKDERSSRRGRKSPARATNKKQKNNSAVYIGLAVGTFVLLIIIIAATLGGGSSHAVSGADPGSALRLEVRKSIYSEYKYKVEQLKAQTKAAIEMSPKYRSKIQGKLKGRKTVEAKKIYNKYSKKYKMTESYFNTYIIGTGDKENW